MKYLILILAAAASAPAAEFLEIQITRTKRYWFINHTTTERHVLGLGSEHLAGVFTFDENYMLDQSRGDAVAITPGVSSTSWHNLDVKRTGGQLFISRSGESLSFDLFYRSVTGSVQREGNKVHSYKDSSLSGVVSTDPIRPTVLKDITPTIPKIVITHRAN